MPTLPGRASSITDVLASAHPTPETSPTAFDWRLLVQERRPGDQTPEQQRQAQRFARIRQETRHWAEAHGLSLEHLDESAFYATVATSSERRHEQALALAQVVYWIYLLDDLLDRRDFKQLAGLAPETVDATLDVELAAILRPLVPFAGQREVQRWGLHWEPASIGTADGPLPPVPLEACAQLSTVLESLLETLRVEWAHLPTGWRHLAARQRLVARELALCAAGMRQEILWNVTFARHPEYLALPSLESYLHGGEVSIGMPAVAAVMASFEQDPSRAWQRGLKAILAGGRVVRLTNDLHTYFADVEEGKVTAVSIGLHELGYRATGLDPETSGEVRHAQEHLVRELTHAIGAFAGRYTQMIEGPLSCCVRYAVAFALAVYGDGSRLRAAPSAA
jgi:hypothetical protein